MFDQLLDPQLKKPKGSLEIPRINSVLKLPSSSKDNIWSQASILCGLTAYQYNDFVWRYSSDPYLTPEAAASGGWAETQIADPPAKIRAL